MFVSLDVAMVMKTAADRELAVEEPDQEKKQEEGEDHFREQLVERLRRRVGAGTDITRCGYVESEQGTVENRNEVRAG